MTSTAIAAARTTTLPSVRWALGALALSMLLSSLGISIANVGLPTMEHAFNASFQEVQWIVLAYLLATTTLSVSAGYLGDRIGHRRLLLAGLLLFTAASVACGLAPELWMLIAARAVQGTGAAVMMALAVALVGEAVAKEKTGSAMGLLGTMSAVGTALGPSLGGVLIASFGWPALFVVIAPLGVVAFAFAFRFLPTDRPVATGDTKSFDVTGTLLLAATLGAYALAMTYDLVLLVAAFVGLVIFVTVEARVASPLIRLAMLRDRNLASGLVMSLLVSTVVMATLVVGPFYLTHALGLDAAFVGFFLAVGPLAVALTGVPAGRIVDRFGAQRTTVAGLVAMGGGSVLLALLPVAYGVIGYVASVAILTAGYALFQTANNTAIMADVDRDQRGVVSGLLNLSRSLGLITGASVMGAVFAYASRGGTAPEAVASAMQTTFAVAAGLIGAGLGVAALARRAT